MRAIVKGLLLTMLCICGVWDIKKKEVPLVCIVGLGILSVTDTLLAEPKGWWGIISGLLIGVGCLLASRYTKEAIGYGDSWIILELGICLGGMRLLQMLLVASLAAGLFGLFCLWVKGWKRNTSLPFVPFIALAYLGAMVT